MDPFGEYIYAAFETRIRSWDRARAQDIYALSFYVSQEENDPRRVTVTLGYNTNQQWHASTPRAPDLSDIGWPVASDAAEAKWNYAFWLQNEEVVIGSGFGVPDTKGMELRSAWIERQGLAYSDDDEARDFDRTLELDHRIQQSFAELCIRVAQRLHERGVIRSCFGRPVPVLVHELEYHGGIAAQTRLANPPGVAQEFEAWVRSL